MISRIKTYGLLLVAVTCSGIALWVSRERHSANAWRARIGRLTADRSCVTVADCQVLPVGENACGFAEGQLVIAKSRVDSGALASALAALSAARRREHRARHEVALCVPPAAVELGCVDGQCIAQPPLHGWQRPPAASRP
jgi:hypothetical protein